MLMSRCYTMDTEKIRDALDVSTVPCTRIKARIYLDALGLRNENVRC
jgi:hypothetical protein